MNEVRDFSKRYGFQTPPSEVIREEAPEPLRTFILRNLSYRASGSAIHNVRRLVTNTLKYIPNPAHQFVEEIWNEVVRAVNKSDWFLIYDLVEEMYRDLSWSANDQEAFLEEVNE
jgi:hypothetical protein